MRRKGSVLEGALLVAGTSIGGGVLALPVLTSQAGFFPALAIFFLCWLVMATTGLLFMELSLWLKGDANIISMAKSTLGKEGEWLAWILYIFLFFSLTIAYLDGCGDLFVQISENSVTDWQGTLLFMALFIPFVFVGVRVIGPLNEWFMMGLATTYVLFIVFAMPHMEWGRLLTAHWHAAPYTLPIAFVSFAYQGVVPTLCRYLDYDPPKIRKSILIGSFLPLIAYAVWQGVVMGIVPLEGAGSLQETLVMGRNAVHPLKNHLPQSRVLLVGNFFAFFALITSFFGVSLGLIDFLADGLSIEKTRKGKALLCAMIYIPTGLIAIWHPHIFLGALGVAGGIGCALLLGLLPVLMVWSARYHLQIAPIPGAVQGGKGLFVVLILFVALEVIFEIIHLAA